MVAPTNNRCIDNSLSFQCNASTDHDRDANIYQILVVKDNQFSQIAYLITGYEINRFKN